MTTETDKSNEIQAVEPEQEPKQNGKSKGFFKKIKDSMKEQEEKKEETPRDPNLPIPPDGGWGWAVVFGCFMIHVIADGISYSFGVFLPPLLEYFDAGRGELGGLGAVMIGITWGCGPIASAVTNKFGCRRAAMFGAVLAWFGFFISVWAPSVLYLYFSIGVIGGLGFGIMYLPSIVAVSFYFEKRRAFATGIAVCGSGVGTFLIAPLSNILLDYYGWKGAMLIQSGLILNCILCGALFRPLKVPNAKKQPLAEQTDDAETSKSVHDKLNGDLKKADATSVQSLPLNSLAASESANKLHKSDLRLDRTSSPSSTHEEVSPMARKDIFYSASLQNIPMYKSNPSLYAQSVASIPNAVEEEKTCGSKCCPCKVNIWRSFKEMTDFSLFLDLVFLLFSISNLLTSIGFCVPYIYLPDRAKQLKINEQRGSFLVSAIGIGNMLGRLIFGWIADRPCVNRLMLYNTVLTICGIASMVSVVCQDFTTLMIYSTTFGFMLGVYVGITPVVLVDLLGLDKLTNAFGIVLLWQGIGAVVGPPLLGFVYDMTLNYNNTFFLMGVIVAVSGLMLYPIPLIQRYVQRKKDRKVTEHEIDMGKKPVTESGHTALPDEEEANESTRA